MNFSSFVFPLSVTVTNFGKQDDWNSVYTTTYTNSGKWESNYTTTNSNSALWSNWSTVSANYALGSQYVKLSGDTMTGGLTVAGNISASGAINALSSNVGIVVDSKTGSYTFTNSDNNRIIHFNTSTRSLCAIIPASLRTDFNCAVMNTGTNTLVLSTYQTLRATGTTITTQYGAAFVYKDSANNVYAVGRL